MTNVALAPVDQVLSHRGRGRGQYPKGSKTRQSSRRKGSLPEYLDQAEVETLIGLAPHAAAKLLMLIQWRAGLRISEALALEARDVQLDGDRPTLKVRQGKGNRDRVVPVHPELAAALRLRLDYGGLKARFVRHARLIGVGRQQASKWIAGAVARAVEVGLLQEGREITSHTLRHSYARHLLQHGIPLNVLSKWLGHTSIDSTLWYLELLPDPAGTLAAIP